MKNKQKKPNIPQIQQSHIRTYKIATDEEIANALKSEFGNLSAVARILNIDRGTLYNRIEKSDYLKEVRNNVDEYIGDKIESNIIKIAFNTNPDEPTPVQATMLKYYAGTKLRNRGYGQAQQIEMKADINANINGQLDLTYMTIEEKQKILNQLKESDEILNSLKSE